jgi:uncharacterized membrane protein
LTEADAREDVPEREFTAAEIGAIAHLYRAEVGRSTMWRTRLDNTTNWAVVTTGIALSLSYSGPDASPLPLVLVLIIVAVFLGLEARRYRYFNVWRARCRLMETDFYAPLLAGDGVVRDGEWNTLLSNDLRQPKFHVSYLISIGRRLRRNYAYIFGVNAFAYIGKLAIDPTPLTGMAEFFERAAIGPVPGTITIVLGLMFHGTWLAIAVLTLRHELRNRRKTALIAIG